MTIFGKKVPILFSLIIWLVIWELVGRSEIIFIFPPLSKVLKATVDIVKISTFYDDVMLSLRSFGTGLGLSLAREIARTHDGDLALAEGEGDRVTFVLTLPAAEAAP